MKSCPEVDLRQALAIGIVLTGIIETSRPSKIETGILCDFVRKYYPDYTPDEMRFAIENAMARKYADFNPKCYGSFSSEYLGGLLEAYEKWDNGDDQRFHAGLYDIDPNPMRSTVQYYYEEFLEGKIEEYYPNHIYYQLVHDRYIKPLPGRLAYRYYPKQIEIKRVFASMAARELKAIYVSEEEFEKTRKEKAGLAKVI